MPSETWKRLAVGDDLFELRELLHLSLLEEFAPFFRLPSGSECEDKSAVVGRAGFLFVNDGSNRWKDQLSGELEYSADVSEATSQKLDEYNERLKQQGIAFRFVIVPEKDIVYPDLSPNVASSPASKRAARQIASRHSAYTLYSDSLLVAATGNTNTYHARNSHFNFFGGMIVAEQILSSLGATLPSDEQILSNVVYWPDDLGIKWVPNLRTRRRMLGRFYSEEEVVKADSHVGRYLILRNPNAANKEPLIIFGDSYSWNPDAGVARYLALAFAEVHFLWKKQIDWDLIERVKPKTVLLQSAERFLIKGLQ